MTAVGATYRLQLRGGVTFRDAAHLASHLSAAGITHLYLSPAFTAAQGSTHGYDVADHNRLDPALGGEAGFRELAGALRVEGLSILLDIVPNHMAASTDNPWWHDILKYGPQSRYGAYFDVDWQDGLVLPILGQPYGVALAAGDIELGRSAEGESVLVVPGHQLPLAPGTETIRDVHECHEAQHYRLTHWRLARDGLTYRRFFEIHDLVGVRVEDPAIFNDVHRLIRSLIESGDVTALRVDHVDGLADPASYLARLSTFGVPILVEKILEEGEKLPSWSVLGTTGYEFIAGLAALFVHPQGLGLLSEAYAAIADDDVARLTLDAKRLMVTVNLRTELERLTWFAHAAFAEDPAARDHGPDTVRRGITALLCAMPVYRTYIADVTSEMDRAVLKAAAENAPDEGLDERRVIHDLVALLTSGDERAGEFVTRFQQSSGPVMAKAVEDTLFYRHHRLLALNEVGSHPDLPLGVEGTLTALRASGLAATQTHDTKRGEDARARLYALSDPLAAQRWLTIVDALAIDAPEPWRWALAQMWLGALPLADDQDFPDRLEAAAIKSVREAKQETTWMRQNAAFEVQIANAARALAVMPVPDGVEWILRAGAIVGLSQALLKTAANAAPDIYQGTFGWDFSLVDPDNRRPVDFAAEARLCDYARTADFGASLLTWRDGTAKARVLLEGLRVRRERPGLFGPEAAITLLSDVDAAVAVFWRTDGSDAALYAVPRFPYSALEAAGLALRPGALVARIEVAEPLTCRLTGHRFGPGVVDMGEVLALAPVTLATLTPA